MSPNQRALLIQLSGLLTELYDESISDDSFHDELVDLDIFSQCVLDIQAKLDDRIDQRYYEATLTDREKVLKQACEWHQMNDKNGDFIQLWKDYTLNDIDQTTLIHVLVNTFKRVLNEDLGPEDISEKAFITGYIALIEEGQND